MLRIRLFIAFWLIGMGIIAGKQVVSFPGIINPQAFSVYNNRLYVTESAQISIYSLKNFKLITKFGKEGEGPQEFKLLPFSKSVDLCFLPDRIQVNSRDKISYFSHNGSFISEKKIATAFRYPISNIFPVKNKFIVQQLESDEKGCFWRAISIYDSNFKKEKTMVKFPIDRKKIYNLMDMTFRIRVLDDRIFIVASREFVIDVFDITGKKIYSITRDYTRLKLTAREKEDILNSFRLGRGTRKLYHYVKDALTFPDVFPAINDFFTCGGKLYVMTYKREDNHSEFFIMDSKGKLSKKVWLEVRSYMKMDTSSLHTISDNKLYQLVENEETETWDLFCDAID